MPIIQTRAGRVAYSESGSGPTVLLLHATLHDRHDFDPILEALGRRDPAAAAQAMHDHLSDVAERLAPLLNAEPPKENT